MKSDTIHIQPIPYGLRYSTWSQDRSATKAEQEEYREYERKQAAIRTREKETP